MLLRKQTQTSIQRSVDKDLAAMRVETLLKTPAGARGDRLKFGNRYTPDVPYVESMDEHWLFVYGDHREHFNRAGFLKFQEAEFKGRFITVDRGYVMMMYTPGQDSTNEFFTMDEDSSFSAHVYGELYRVNAKTIKILDNVFWNGLKMKRERIKIRALRNYTRNLEVWWYKGREEHWESLMSQYNWRFKLVDCQQMYENGGNAKPTQFFSLKPKDQYINNWYRHISADQSILSSNLNQSQKVTLPALSNYTKRTTIGLAQIDDIENDSPLYSRYRYGTILK